LAWNNQDDDWRTAPWLAGNFRTMTGLWDTKKRPHLSANAWEQLVDYQGRGGYGVRFDDKPEITEYVNSDWMTKEETRL